MQNLIECGSGGQPRFPKQVAIRSVRVYKQGAEVKHDYSCPVCRENHAVLDLADMVMQPCNSCRSLGYIILKHKSILARLIGL